jgi:hypothetical protein
LKKGQIWIGEIDKTQAKSSQTKFLSNIEAKNQVKLMKYIFSYTQNLFISFFLS